MGSDMKEPHNLDGKESYEKSQDLSGARTVASQIFGPAVLRFIFCLSGLFRLFHFHLLYQFRRDFGEPAMQRAIHPPHIPPHTPHTPPTPPHPPPPHTDTPTLGPAPCANQTAQNPPQAAQPKGFHSLRAAWESPGPGSGRLGVWLPRKKKVDFCPSPELGPFFMFSLFWGSLCFPLTRQQKCAFSCC